MQPPQGVLSHAQRLEVAVDGRAPEIPHEFQHVAKLLRGDPRFVEARRRIERSDVPEGIEQASRPDARPLGQPPRGPALVWIAIERGRDERASRDDIREIEPAERVQRMMPGARAIRLEATVDERGGRHGPPAFCRLSREQREQDVRLAQPTEAASKPARLPAQPIGVIFGIADHEREGFAEPTGGHARSMDAFSIALVGARRLMCQRVTQRANDARQIVRNGRGSMAHWRPPVPVTSL